MAEPYQGTTIWFDTLPWTTTTVDYSTTTLLHARQQDREGAVSGIARVLVKTRA